MEDFDSTPRQEEIMVTKEQVIKSLLANREDLEPLAKFIDQLQARVDEGNIGLVELCKEIADIYVDLSKNNPDWVEHARLALEDLLLISSQLDDQAMVSYARMTQDKL